MSAHTSSAPVSGLDLSRWRNLPVILLVAGAVAIAVGVLASGKGLQQLGFSWLVGFMFCLSLCLGGLFLVIVHHLFDASWSVPTRRFCEHIACLLSPTMLILFIPIALLAPRIYPWLTAPLQNHPPETLHAKFPLFTPGGYYASALACFIVWWIFSNRLRSWSLRQDETGSVECTRKMRFFAALGVVFFALTLTIASIVWMSGLMEQWYSTMYGVTYFAGSVWVTLPTVYVIAMLLQRTTILRELIKEKTYYMIGSIFFAFTVFWAYVNFAQYFIIWNANMPEETFWYVLREKGSWNWVGKYVIIFGHFFVPFLMLLRIDFKLKLKVMIPLAVWAWLMHFVDMEFQIMPALHPVHFLNPGLISDLGCVALLVGVLMMVFLASLRKYPLYPLKDPRLAEALEVYKPMSTDISTAPQRAK
jgi:hypothetical protein